MPNLRLKVSIRVDGEVLAGFPLFRSLTATEQRLIDYDALTATDSTSVFINNDIIPTHKVVAVRISKTSTLGFFDPATGDPVVGTLPLGPDGLFVVFNAAWTMASALTIAVSDAPWLLQGVQAG